MNPAQKRRFGDRYDGYRLRKIDPIYQLVPVVMRTRLDSQVLFDDIIDITELEKFLHEMRREGYPQLRTIHVVIAAIVRVISQKPRINRFVAGKKIYARNVIRISMAVKRSLTEDATDTDILPFFTPADTLTDVVERMESEFSSIRKNNGTGEKQMDIVAKAFSFCPTAIKSFAVFVARRLDSFGLMPKVIYNASPFHSSVFVTDVGSLGIQSVYHHLYEFGTTSVFVAVGKKTRISELNADGQLVSKKALHIRYVVDERICDGFYFASAIKMFKRILLHPKVLLTPPEQIFEDSFR